MDKYQPLTRRHDTRESYDYDNVDSVSWEARKRWHSSFAATPLNSRHLREPNGEPYILAALDYVNGLLDDLSRTCGGGLTSHVGEHLGIAIQSAVLTRIEENEMKSIPVDADNMSTLLFTKACYGGASPEELLDLVIAHPQELASLELAKQTHPGVWSATSDMDGAVEDAVVRRGFVERGGTKTRNVRHVITRVDNTVNPGTATLVRKADVAMRRLASGGTLMVVQRDCMVVDLTHPDMTQGQNEVQRWLRLHETRDRMRGDAKVPYGGKELTGFVDAQFETNIAVRSLALVPAVRSYYAHVL